MSAVVQDLRRLAQLRVFQLAALAGLLGLVGWRSMSRKYSVIDLDIWWHLAVGDWIVKRFAVPHTGIFSWTAATHPWVAYSWGYEVLLSRAFAWGGLLGIALFGVLLTLAVAYAVFWMLRRLSGRFWVSCALALMTCYLFVFNLAPRPVFFSMVLFTITLTLILEAKRSGRVQTLYWLPPIFVLWANLHIQFIYGLFLVGLLIAVNLLHLLARSFGFATDSLQPPTLPPKKLAALFVACALASCVGPYSFYLYQVVLDYSKAQLPYSMIAELQPLSFSYPTDYGQLLLAATAFFAIGWRKKIDLFKLALLVFASVVAFRTMRDSWFICIPAIAVLADFPPEEAERDRMETPAENAGLAVVLVLLLALTAHNADFSKRDLDRAITGNFPVYAANFLRRTPLPGPLYNEFNWGGFLIWYLPQYPVAIDGRNDMYGDVMDDRCFTTRRGDYSSDPYLNESGVLLLQKGTLLAELLKKDSRFSVVYQDNTAVVLVRNGRAEYIASHDSGLNPL
jgi:hypothetical protein